MISNELLQKIARAGDPVGYIADRSRSTGQIELEFEDRAVPVTPGRYNRLGRRFGSVTCESVEQAERLRAALPVAIPKERRRVSVPAPAAPLTIDAAVTKERLKETVTTERATTDTKVAKAARRRSNGRSEYSGEFTFVRKTGEWGTSLHHPWGRQFDGLAWVINLTGSEHDEVEYGIDGDAMNERMKAFLTSLYPEVVRP